MTKTKPQKSARWRIAILATLVMLVAVGWTMGWFYIAGQLRNAVARTASGSPSLTCAALSVGGFPFRFDLNCQDPVIRSGDLTVSAKLLQATTLFYRPTHVIAFATGPAMLEDAFTGSQRRLEWSKLEASIRFNGWRPERISLVGEDAAVTDIVFAQSPMAQTKHLELHLIDAGDANTPGMMKVAGYLKLDNGTFPGFDLHQTNAEIALDLTPLPQDIRNWAAPQVLGTLLANRAQLTLTQARLTATGLDAQLTGQIALNARFEPAGKLVLISKGLRQRLAPFLQPTTVAAIVGGPDTRTGKDQQTFILKDGTVSAAGLPLFHLPALL